MDNLNSKNISKVFSWLEPFLTLLVFIGLFIVVARSVPAAPNSTDVFLYHDIGLKGIKDPFVLNRYFHIYLQRLFTSLSATPLLGLRYFWSFLFSSTIALVYVLAHKVSGKNGPFFGALAVAFFLSTSFLTEITGIPLVDMTAMLLGMSIVTLYVYSLDENKFQKTALILLGICMFFGFKSKETTIPISLVIIFLGWQNGKFNLATYWSKAKYVVIGVGLAIGLFGLINQIVLKDFFFGLRFTEFSSFFSTYVKRAGADYSENIYDNWVYGFWLTYALLPSVFYLLSGLWRKYKIPAEYRVLWLTPLAVTLFVIASVNNRYGINPRFILPAVPIVCALAPHIFQPDLLQDSCTSQSSMQNALFFITSLGLAGLGVFLIVSGSYSLNFDLVRTYSTVIMPVLLIILIGFLLYSRQNLLTSILSVSILIVILVFPASRNIKEILRVHENSSLFEETVKPIEEFQDSISPSENMLLCVDSSVFNKRPLALAKNSDELSGLFNIVTGSDTASGNFFIDNLMETKDLLEKKDPLCTYILINSSMRDVFEKNDSFGQKIKEYYLADLGQNDGLLLYSKR
ncbi:MAG: hypothetical protein VB108_03505 [Anaerolineaceae bacterium]|nr:hypothetical protein [Anaerolineaceae bacterium]